MGEIVQIILPGEPTPPPQVQQIIAPMVEIVEVVERGPVGPVGDPGPEGPAPSDVVTHEELDARIPLPITVSTIPPSSPIDGQLWVDLN